MNQGAVEVLKPIEISSPRIPEGPFKFSATIASKPSNAEFENRLFVAVKVAELVLNDPELVERMHKAWWNGKPGFQDTSDTPTQVIEKTLNQDIKAYYEFKRNRFRSVTAWTFANDPVIYFNTRNFMGRDICGIVGTLFHEYSHKKGYTHSSAKRTLSVPYYLGTQASTVCKKHLK